VVETAFVNTVIGKPLPEAHSLLNKEVAVWLKHTAQTEWNSQYGEKNTVELIKLNGQITSLLLHSAKAGAYITEADMNQYITKTLNEVTVRNKGVVSFQKSPAYARMEIEKDFKTIKERNVVYGDNPGLSEMKSRAQDPVLNVLRNMISLGQTLQTGNAAMLVGRLADFHITDTFPTEAEYKNLVNWVGAAQTFVKQGRHNVHGRPNGAQMNGYELTQMLITSYTDEISADGALLKLRSENFVPRLAVENKISSALVSMGGDTVSVEENKRLLKQAKYVYLMYVMANQPGDIIVTGKKMSVAASLQHLGLMAFMHDSLEASLAERIECPSELKNGIYKADPDGPRLTVGAIKGRKRMDLELL
jgi:hypothetical protein